MIWPSREIVLISKPPQQGNRKSHIGKTKQKPSHKTSTQKQNEEDTENCNKPAVDTFSFPWEGCTIPEATTIPGQWVEWMEQGSIPTPCSKNPFTKMSWHRRCGVVQLLSPTWLFATLWTSAGQTSLSFTVSWSCSNSCPLSQWCHPTISSSSLPFSSCPQSFPASGSFPRYK